MNPPRVAKTVPTGELWLHEPVRFVFSEPVDVSEASATATIDGTPVGVTVGLEGDRIVAVSLPSTLRGMGNVEVTLDGAIRDRGGNLAEVPIVAQLSAPAWSTPPIDRGAALDAPAIAIGDDAIVAAWVVGGQVVASKYAGLWTPLGDPFGSGVSSVSASIDDAGSPLVAWIEAGVAHVWRHQTNGWIDLGTPGNGSRVVLSGTSAAVFGTSVQVRTLTPQDTWGVVGDYAINGTLVGEPAFAGTAVGWIERTSSTQIRVYNNGSAMSPINVDDSTRVSLASRGNTLAIAWDEFGGSWNVAAAIANGSSWTRLGRILDVDAAGNATSPAIALDSAGKPIVAWRERIETNERGIVARWSGSAWSPIGDAQWNGSATMAPSRPALVVRDDVPAIASIAGGALRVTRFNGPASVGPGMQRASISGCSVNPNSPPSTLFATGCFSAGGTPHPGLVPYDIINELWTDGAKKRRWIGLPNGASMTTSSTEAWAAPAGTIVAKEFAIETTPGNPATRRPVETRLLVNTGSGWLGFSYMWRDDGSNADLLNDGTYTKDWATTSGTYRHLYPSRSQCLSCHENSFGPLLGIRPAQLQRWFDYNGTIADQAMTLAAIGVGPAATGAPYISTHDRSATWEQRTRSYMAANCAHCHNPNHIAIKDLRYTTPLAQTRLCEVITPGYPQNSIVYARVTQRPGMPPLGTLVPDPLIEQTLGRWISGMTSCP